MAKAKNDLDVLRADLRALQEDFDALTRDAKKTVANSVDNGIGGLTDTIQQLRERLEQSATQVREYGERSAESVRHSVQERPFGSMLTALAIGFVVATVLGRRS